MRLLACIALIILPIVLPCAAARAQSPLRDIEYARVGASSLKLDLYLPADTARGAVPLIIWVHGGGWSGGDKAGTPAARMAARGYAVASINYRLSGTAIWPAQINDCKGAVRWLRANAAKYHLDPARFGVWGSSAGGHLVAVMGATGGVRTYTVGATTMDIEGDVGGNAGQSSSVQAVCDWYGPSDFLRMGDSPSNIKHLDPGSPEANLIGGTVPDNPEKVALANPITYLTPDDPPFLIMHGTKDMTVPFTQSVLLDSALRAMGLWTSFRPMLDAGHGGGAFNSDSAATIVNDFFDQHLKALSGVATGTTAADEAAAIAIAPNPARGRALARVTVATAGHAVLDLYTADGRHAARALDAELERGEHLVEIDATALPPGAYIARLRTASGVWSRGLIVAR